jgi:hypothetical protein
MIFVSFQLSIVPLIFSIADWLLPIGLLPVAYRLLLNPSNRITAMDHKPSTMRH